MTDIVIRITTDASGAVTGFQQVSGAAESLNQSVGKASDDGMAKFVAGNVQMVEGLIAGAAAAAKMVDEVNSIGVNSLRARAGLDALTNSHADEFLNKMISSTRGLVDDTDLMHTATQALSAGVVTTSGQMAKLAEDGAALGRVFMGDASQGINVLTMGLEGNTRGLKQLGINMAAVNDETERLVAGGMDETLAKRTAIMDQATAATKKLGEAAYGTGTALERAKVQVSDFFEAFSERAAQGLEGTITGVQALADAVSQHPLATAQAAGQTAANATGVGKQQANTVAGLEAKLDASGMLFPQAQTMTPDQFFGGQDVLQATIMSQVRASQGGAFGNMGGSSSTTIGVDKLAEIRANIDGVVRSEDQMREAGIATMNAFQGQAAAARDTAIATENAAAAAQKEADARRQMSVNQLFGVEGNRLAADAGSGMDSAIAQGRSALQAQDKNKSARQQAQDLAAYDDAAQTSMNKYLISTGQATEASIKFKGIQDQLGESLKAGKISVGSYVSEMGALEHALEQGATSMTQLTKAQRDFASQNATGNGKQSIAFVNQHMALDDNTTLGQALTGQKQGTSDPFAGAKKSADDATAAAAKIGPAATLSSLQSTVAGAVIHTSMSFAAAGASALNGQLSSALNALRTISGRTWNVTISTSGAAVNGSGAVRTP